MCVVQGEPFESELEYLAYGCQGDALVQSAVLSFQQRTALQVHTRLSSKSLRLGYILIFPSIERQITLPLVLFLALLTWAPCKQAILKMGKPKLYT